MIALLETAAHTSIEIFVSGSSLEDFRIMP